MRDDVETFGKGWLLGRLAAVLVGIEMCADWCGVYVGATVVRGRLLDLL